MATNKALVAVSALIVFSSLTGCVAPSQKISPTEMVQRGDTICVTKERSNRLVAFNALLNQLKNRNLNVIVVPTLQKGFDDGRCTFVMDATTVSKWDVATYTRSLTYSIYKGWQEIGNANVFVGEGITFSKFNSTEQLVSEILDQLMPNLSL